MKNSSQQIQELDPRLLEIEQKFSERDIDSALIALDAIERSNYNPEGMDLGIFLLLKARRAIYTNRYDDTIRYCYEALEKLETSSLNKRIGRLHLLLYYAYTAQGDLKQAEMAARDALASYRRIRNRQGILDAYNSLGRIYYLRSNYVQAAEYVNEAIQFAEDDPVRKGQLLGNLGRIYLLTGDLDNAEEKLLQSYEMSRKHDLPRFLVRDHLSLGYLYIRRRQFHLAGQELDNAMELILALGNERDHIICLEYMGELAFEKQDFVEARRILQHAVELALDLAPESALVSQCLRRLAEAELALGYHDQAMQTVQKALDLAQKIGEQAEIGLSHRVISLIFQQRSEVADARRHGLEGIEILRQVGDNFELGRSIIAYGSFPLTGLTLSDRKTLPLLQEAEKIFSLMGDDYYLARCHFEMGHFCQQVGKNGEALEHLKEALRGFRNVADTDGLNRVSEYLQSLSKQAIEQALSDNNKFKIFGNVISGQDYESLKSGSLKKIFDLLIGKTAADRGFIINTGQSDEPELSITRGVNEEDREALIVRFVQFINDNKPIDSPSLILDCSEDPDYAELLPAEEGRVGSVIVLPLILDSEILGYIYLDRLFESNGSSINPFCQDEIDFAVGYADLAAFKIAQYQKHRLMEDNLRLRAQLLDQCVFVNIVTQSRPFMEILNRVRQVANSNMAISITGETGTGKDLLAKAIHYNSNRKDKRFVSVNCAALPESLLESELFGYKRGAFTGADRDKPGLFEEADGGTFFLDEIADMPLSIQAKILRVLETQEITRLGDTRPRLVDVRVISATNKDLKEEMGNNTFRNDLYYRLCALNFKIPPLRERREDIPLLVEHFLKESKCKISPDALKYLLDYNWPGNVRELENEVKKLVLLANNEGVITPSLLSARILGDDMVDYQENSDDLSFYGQDGFSLYDYLAEYEKRFIIKALQEQNGIKKRAADSLQIPESTLRLKLKQYKIDPKRLDTIN